MIVARACSEVGGEFGWQRVRAFPREFRPGRVELAAQHCVVDLAGALGIPLNSRRTVCFQRLPCRVVGIGLRLEVAQYGA